MMEDKLYPVLESPKVNYCFGIHLHNNKYYPFVSCCPGYFTANSDRFVITINGIGSHAMSP